MKPIQIIVLLILGLYLVYRFYFQKKMTEAQFKYARAFFYILIVAIMAFEFFIKGKIIPALITLLLGFGIILYILAYSKNGK